MARKFHAEAAAMTKNNTWQKDEVNYRLAKILLQNLVHDGLITADESQQILQRLRVDSSPLITDIEEDE
jgi:hypothetical protein